MTPALPMCSQSTPARMGTAQREPETIRITTQEQNHGTS